MRVIPPDKHHTLKHLNSRSIKQNQTITTYTGLHSAWKEILLQHTRHESCISFVSTTQQPGKNTLLHQTLCSETDDTVPHHQRATTIETSPARKRTCSPSLWGCSDDRKPPTIPRISPLQAVHQELTYCGFSLWWKVYDHICEHTSPKPYSLACWLATKDGNLKKAAFALLYMGIQKHIADWGFHCPSITVQNECVQYKS